jgi:GH15 family glucan-1,4-alpha-glucosidase
MLKAVERSGGELRTLYTVRGDRGPPEHQLGHLPGHGGARPVNVGNGAGSQLQLDTRGELMDMLLLARQHGVIEPKLWWPMQCHILESLEQNWHEPDAGIWEMRGDPRCFTHSRVMAWVAFDRSIHDAECYGLEGPLDRWRQTRDRIHAQVLGDGIDHDRNCFTQVYGGKVLDGALLRLPLVGFLPPDDPRIRATVAAIERELSNDGLVYRYRRGTDENPGPWEGAFLPCSFWLVDNWVLQDRRDEAAALFERLLSHCNDVGLLSEEIDPGNGHLLGNFPQSLTHLALVNSARMLSGKALHRGAQKAVA